MECSTQAEADTKLKVIFLPWQTKGHINPIVDAARVFAMHNVDVTIITTPVAAAIFQNSIDLDSTRGRSIRTHVLKFPYAQVGLPEGIELFTTDTPPDMLTKIGEGLSVLQGEIEQLFEDLKADCIVTDMFYPWTADAAAKLGIPRLIFFVSGYFPHSAEYSVKNYAPHKGIESDTDKFALPGLPHHLEMTRLQIQDWLRAPNGYTYLMEMIRDSEKRSYGSLVNSFCEMEGPYEEHYKRVTGTKSWSIGPVSLWANQDASNMDARGNAKAEGEGWLQWLNSKPESSVLYVSFGSMNKFPTPQLVEIARALEDSGHNFMWVVAEKKEDEDWGNSFLDGFEKKVKASNKGCLIWGWAPQVLILENPAIGGLVTHSGWNTVIESMNAGLPMVTWPLYAEQFYNERQVIDLLKIGVAVGVKEWRQWNDFENKEVVKSEDIGKAIALLMDGGEKSADMRRRARELSDAAKTAIKVGGSSQSNMLELMEELKSFKLRKVNGT